MADLSVNKILAKSVNANQNGVSGQYAKLKAKYEQFKKQYKTSDFANAPTLLEQEIKLLKDLKAAAILESIADEEIKSVDERIDEISKELKTQYKVHSDNQGQTHGNAYTADTIRYIPETMSKLSVDTKLFEKLLEQAENPELIKDFASKLSQYDVSLEDITRITNMLLVPIVDDNGIKTGKFSIPEQSVKAVITAQGALHSYEQNEKNEVKSPVYKLDVDYDYTEDGFFIKRKGKVIYSEPNNILGLINKPTAREKHQQYQNSVKSKERRVLYDFIKKYKNENGVIPYQYSMAALQLRKSGIVNGELLNLIDACVNSDGKINRNKLYKISELKKAGALSEDILKILDKCRVNEDGKYNSIDVDTAIGLTKAVLGAKQVCELLPVLKDYASSKENVYTAYDFVTGASQYFKNKDNLVQLVKMCMTNDNELDEDAVDMIDTMFFNGNNNLTEEEFIDYAKEILQIARGSNDRVSDGACSICYGLSELNTSLNKTKYILRLCQDANGNINQDLSDIVWTIGVNDDYKSECSADDIIKLIKICKKEDDFDNGNIEKLMSLIKQNIPINDILTQFLG